jgi:glycosyltransferase involved in cell wall biosynthesis
MTLVDASVAICAYNEEERVAQALESALRQQTRYAWEVIIVDDGSTDGTWREVERIARTTESECVRCLYVRIRHGGLAMARNVALEAGQGRIVVYLDADAIADTAWLNELIYALDEENAVAASGPIEVLNPEAPFAQFIDRFHHRRAYAQARAKVPIIGANMAFRREVLEDVGGFDPRFVSRGDDDSVRWRVAQKGDLVFVPSAKVRHERPANLRAWLSERKANGKARVLVDEFVDAQSRGSGQVSLTGRSRIARGRLRTAYVALVPTGLIVSAHTPWLGLSIMSVAVVAGATRSAIYFFRGTHLLLHGLRAARDRLVELARGIGVAALSCLVNDASYFLATWLRRKPDWTQPRPSPVIEQSIEYIAERGGPAEGRSIRDAT